MMSSAGDGCPNPSPRRRAVVEGVTRLHPPVPSRIRVLDVGGRVDTVMRLHEEANLESGRMRLVRPARARQESL